MVDGYAGAVAGKCESYCGTDTVFAAGAGDDGDLAGEGECVWGHVDRYWIIMVGNRRRMSFWAARWKLEICMRKLEMCL